MPEETVSRLAEQDGLRVLVVEDVFLVAESIAATLQDEGYVVVGPVGRLAEGARLAAYERLDGALLDVNLAGERCFPIAAKLKARDVPFAFLTGYGGDGLPTEWRDVPRLAKPFDLRTLAKLAENLFRRDR